MVPSLLFLSIVPLLVSAYVHNNIDCHACASGWTSYDCKCYRPFQVPKTWMEAEDICADYGAHLSSVYDESEADFLANLVNCTMLSRTVWTGGFMREYEDSLQWTDGTRWGFPTEIPKHPGDVDVCLALDYRRKPWKSLLCSTRNAFICQKSALEE
ncbi:hypothetical protein L596_015300 [Steinernema carpocapsae]|uniref:C-type lectin domain-containing protein n=1 Tax=Steinernema carpocapsae TaxID=34508 RepID=A0A4U5NFG4_STECR|nr:hypothetical protein L596_015300 [Steinernema carpocapsae]